jgi:protease-4
MELTEVDKIAQGRIWGGAKAQQLGLVDELGDLENAIAAAAELVGLPADQVYYMEEDKHPAELLLQRLERARAGKAGLEIFAGLARRFMGDLTGVQPPFFPAGDPRNIYVHSLLPFSVQ